MTSKTRTNFTRGLDPSGRKVPAPRTSAPTAQSGGRTLRPLAIDLMLQLGDLQLLLGDQRFVFRRFRAGDRKSAVISKPLARSAASASFRAAMPSGTASRSASMRRSESQIRRDMTPQNCSNRRFLRSARALRSPTQLQIPLVDSFQRGN